MTEAAYSAAFLCPYSPSSIIFSILNRTASGSGIAPLDQRETVSRLTPNLLANACCVIVEPPINFFLVSVQTAFSPA